MKQPIGSDRIAAARELLAERPELLLTLAGHGRCDACGVLVPEKGRRQHDLFHEALAVVATVVLEGGTGT